MSTNRSRHNPAVASAPIGRRSLIRAGAAGLALAGTARLLAASAASATPVAPVSRVALMSCIHQARPAPALDHVLAYDPQVAIFAGDNVYGDVTGPAMAELAAAYDLAGTRPALAALRSNRAVMPIWDDHDYGVNDGGADFPHKAAAKALFLKFWQIEAGDPRWMRPGLHHAAVFGPEGRRLQVILMDLRSFRTALHPAPQGTAIPGGGRYLPAGPGARMLGEDQWAWLADCFRQPAELRLVVSSVQLVADGHGWEGWSRMPDERARFWRLIRDTGAGGVVLLSGDRHLGAIYRRAAGPDGPPYPVTELTSSSVNLPNLAIVDEPGPNRLTPIWPLENWGRIDIDWWAGTIDLAVVDAGGIPRRRVSVSIAGIA